MASTAPDSKRRKTDVDDSKAESTQKDLKSVLQKQDLNTVLAQMKDGTPISVHSGDSIYAALNTLLTNKILSVPIMDDKVKEKCLGFVDMLDIVAATIETLETTPGVEIILKETPTESKDGKSEEPAKKKSKRRSSKTPQDEDELENTLEWVEEIIMQNINSKAIADFSHADAFTKANISMNLLEAANKLVKPDCKRIAVVDENDNLNGIITQSGLVEYINEEYVDLVNEKSAQVGDIELLSDLVTISKDNKAYHAFKLMRQKKVNSLAVVNDNGTLVDVISASDLTLWTEWVTSGEIFRFSDFSGLRRSIIEFLEESRSQRDIPKKRLLTCTKESKVEDVISDMLYNNVHRLYIVDENNKPIGVIGYPDIINHLVS